MAVAGFGARLGALVGFGVGFNGPALVVVETANGASDSPNAR